MPKPFKIRARRTAQRRAAEEMPPLVRLWVLRILVPLGAHKVFVTPDGYDNEALAIGLGLALPSVPDIDDTDWNSDEPAADFCPRTARARLRALHRQAEAKSAQMPLPSYLEHNLQQLTELVGLNASERMLLAFATLLHGDRQIDEAADWLGNLPTAKVFGVLAQILDLPEAEIRTALARSSALTGSGLLSIDRTGSATLRNKLDLLSHQFADYLLNAETEPVELLRDTVSRCSVPHLSLADYPHIAGHLDILRPYLSTALQSHRRGVNVFIHGAPGTGKSQLARVLAADAGGELFEITSENGDGDPIKGEDRLRAYRAGQAFFSKRRVILLFDETEDVFNDGDQLFGRKSTAQTRKAWINRTLEDNVVPTIWLSNQAYCLDNAFLRRFDVVVELPVPPRQQRERLLTEQAGHWLDRPTLARLADCEVLAPAVVARAAAVLSAIGKDSSLPHDQFGQATLTLVNSTLEAQGYRPIRPHDPARLPETYDPAYVHADADLAALADGLAAHPAARLCLYGPPGTGKTAYGRWLAERLDRPLLLKRASDLLGMYVGETEASIARAFAEAERERAVLLIDEVDSFLHDRQKAQATWEVSAVNEMLTQMETFGGLFIATTNLIDGLDAASLRRFDLKLKFDFLAPAQAKALFTRHCHGLGLDKDAAAADQVGGLDNLTPGDFAAVARQYRFRPLASAAAYVNALAAECRVKPGHRRAIGFGGTAVG